MNAQFIRLIEVIKKKSELEGVSTKVIEQLLVKYLKGKSNLSAKEEKLIVSDIRKELRNYVGRFQDLSEDDSHVSTKERQQSYSLVKEIISDLNANSILDLGCGLNPLFLASKGIEYNALDIDEKSLGKVKSFFNKNGIHGQIIVKDLRNDSLIFPKADLCLIMKVLDLVDKNGHKRAEEIIKNIDSKNFLISFPTKTLSGKPMRHPQRGWIERLLARLGFKFKIYKTYNEIFYLTLSG